MDRVAIVTGGTRGIGEAISIALKDMGMKVAANYAGNDERAREFTERTGIPLLQVGRLRFRRVPGRRRRVEGELGPVDVLVNNAGITRDATMKRMDHPKWQEVIDTEPRRLLQHGQGGVRRHDRPRLRANRQHRLDQRAGRASTGRSIMPRPSRASTDSPRRWRRKALVRA